MGYWKQRKLRKLRLKLTYFRGKRNALNQIVARFDSGSTDIIETYARICGEIEVLKKKIEFLKAPVMR